MKRYALSDEQRNWLTAVQEYADNIPFLMLGDDGYVAAYTTTKQDHLINEILLSDIYNDTNIIDLNKIREYYLANVGNNTMHPIIKNYKK